MTQDQGVLAVIEPELNPRETVRCAARLAGLYERPLVLVLCNPEAGPLYAGWLLSNEAKEVGEKSLPHSKNSSTSLPKRPG